jgi:hypothetical protein
MDEQDGTSSYAIDLPNGGVSYVMGNTIQQGENTDNSQIVVYGAEGLNHSKNEIYVVNNTIVNDRSSAVFLNVANGVQKALFANNLLVGSGDISHGPVEKVTNLHIPKLNRVLTFFAKDPAFIDRANFNYRIKRDSPARNAGSTLKSVNGFSLTPVWEYKHPMKKEKRNNKGKIDIGAFESN